MHLFSTTNWWCCRLFRFVCFTARARACNYTRSHVQCHARTPQHLHTSSFQLSNAQGTRIGDQQQQQQLQQPLPVPREVFLFIMQHIVMPADVAAVIRYEHSLPLPFHSPLFLSPSLPLSPLSLPLFSCIYTSVHIQRSSQTKTQNM